MRPVDFGVPAVGAIGVPLGPDGPIAPTAGPTGPDGPSGPAGPSGSAALSQSASPDRPTGPTGEVGPSGPSGPSGAAGSVGATGATTRQPSEEGADGSAERRSATRRPCRRSAQPCDARACERRPLWAAASACGSWSTHAEPPQPGPLDNVLLGTKHDYRSGRDGSICWYNAGRASLYVNSLTYVGSTERDCDQPTGLEQEAAHRLLGRPSSR